MCGNYMILQEIQDWALCNVYSACFIVIYFAGNFPEGVIGGMFDFTFENDKIAFIKADLILKHKK
jgi:hypothetical protein